MLTIRRNPDVMWREEDDALAEARSAQESGVDFGDIGTAVLFSGGNMLSVNVLGMEIWKLCDGRDLDGIVSELIKEFDVEEALLRTDVAAFIAELATKGFVTYAK
jgi:pyrroloquinoline quinone biosynthesis protein D